MVLGRRRELVGERSMIFRLHAFVGMSPEGLVPVCFAELWLIICAWLKVFYHSV